VILSRVHPAPAETLELDARATRAQLLEWYRPATAKWLRLNLVTSVNGSAAGSDGTSETLSSTADRRILGVIRELSDVVLVGAASVRAEGYQLPRRSTLAIVTVSGNLVGHRLTTDDPKRIIVMCPHDAVARVRETLGEATFIIVDAPGGRIPAKPLVDALRAAGYNSIVCEGGPDLAGQLVAAQLVDEICLTTSPTLSPVTLPPLRPQLTSTVSLELHQLILDSAGSFYARWLIRL
jgi:riboflavin biosynthesis pyrimidine reductase